MPTTRIRVDDLAAWARRKSWTYEHLGDDVREGVRDGIPILLREGIRWAPKHTGALKRSLKVYDRKAPTGGVELALQSDDPAAGMQEDGGILLAHRRKMTVPIGVERAYWDASGTRREARSIAGLFKIRARNGREYLVTRSGRDLVLRFALRTRVRQEGQGWASKAVRKAAPHLPPLVGASIARALLKTDRAGAL